MPNRYIREGILHSPRVRSLDQGAQLFFHKLLLVVDDYGRYSADPYDLARKCEIPQQDVPAWLAATQAADLVDTYQVDGVAALSVKRFRQLKRAKYSRWPAPPAESTEPNEVQQRPQKTEKQPEQKAEKPAEPLPPVKPVRVKPPEAKGMSLDELVAEGIDKSLAADWLAHRRAKKALLTHTAWDALKREAAKADCTISDALTLAMQRGWQGFSCSWLERDRAEQNRKTNHRETPYQAAQREHMAAIAPGLFKTHRDNLEDVIDVPAKGD